MQLSTLITLFLTAAGVVSAAPNHNHNQGWCPTSTATRWRVTTSTRLERYTQTRTVTRYAGRVTRTVTRTVAVPGPVRTRTVTLPGETETETERITLPAVTETTTVTETETLPPVTSTETETLPPITRTQTETLPAETTTLPAVTETTTTTLPAVTETTTTTLPAVTETTTTTLPATTVTITGACTPTPIPGCAAPSPVSNPSFETTSPASWRSTSGGGGATGSIEATEEEEEAHTGRNAYRVTMARDAAGSATHEFAQQLAVCPGTTYEFSAWTRRPLAASGCVATFRLGARVVARSVASIETAWVRAAGSWTARASSVDLTVSVMCSGSVPRGAVKELWVDDVALVAASPAGGAEDGAEDEEEEGEDEEEEGEDEEAEGDAGFDHETEPERGEQPDVEDPFDSTIAPPA